MFQKKNIQINAAWLRKMNTEYRNEEDPCNTPSTNKMLDENHMDPSNTTLLFAPGEGKRPVFHEPLAEYLCFSTIFCGQECPKNAERIAHCSSVIYLNMSSILLIHVLLQIFQISFGKQNIGM